MNFLFYFFYGFFRRGDNDAAFTAILATFILIALYFLAAIKFLFHFGLIGSYPRFGDIYLYNKLYWYIPGAIVLGAVYLYFSSDRRKAIIDEYDSFEDFYTFGTVMLFLFVLLLPIFIFSTF